MVSVVIREGARLTRDQLSQRLGSREHVNSLLRCGVFHRVSPMNRKELFDQLAIETPSEETDDCEFASSFVGLALLDDVLIEVYPKFLSAPPPLSMFKTILNVIQKANPIFENVPSLSDANDSRLGRLPLMVHILQDYQENGLYENTTRINEENGIGEIDWPRTIGMRTAWIQEDVPVYLDLLTRAKVRDDMNVVRRIHRAIISKISAELEHVGILDFFGLEPVSISNEDINDIGSTTFLQFHLIQERQIQFNSRKLRLLSHLLQYLSGNESSSSDSDVDLFGTFSFNLVWEKVCSSVCGNEKATIISQIPHPLWEMPSGESVSTETLEPDIIVTNRGERGCQLGILDAKYYNTQFANGKIAGNPGLQDVVKQFAYQMALEPLAKSNGWTSILNVFLMPGSDSKIEQLAVIHFPVFGEREIVVVRLPALELFNRYLNNGRLDLSEIHTE